MKDPKKEKNNRKTGGNYEQAAGFYLEQHGYQILQYNYRCRIGEIDIVAKEQRKIFQAAMYYLTEHHISNVPCRFDVIGIEGTRIQLVKNAFCG